MTVSHYGKHKTLYGVCDECGCSLRNPTWWTCDSCTKKKRVKKESKKFCLFCNSVFKTKYSQRKTCSKECLQARRRISARNWRERNKENKKGLYKRYKKWAKVPKNKLSKNVSTRIGVCIKEGKSGDSWKNLVPYSLDELMQRIEVNFQEGMSWDNYGDWHIDHKKPVSWFDFESYKDQAFKDCWSLANLQPLWAEDNFKKNNNYAG